MQDQLTAPAAQQNVTRIREFYARVDAGDVSAMCALFATDAVYYRPGFDPLSGREAIERFYRQQRVIRSGAHVLTSVIATDQDVAVYGDFAGTLRDGRAAKHRFAEFFAVAGGALITRRDTFFFVPLV